MAVVSLSRSVGCDPSGGHAGHRDHARHAELLFRTRRRVLCFDGDAAGQRAAWQGAALESCCRG
jgi:hypothetical protein